MKRHYHITFSSSAKSANPLARLLAGIVALAAIPLALILFTGVIAFVLAAGVSIAAAFMFLRFLTPAAKNRDVIEEAAYTVVNENGAMAPGPGKSHGSKSVARRKPVVIEHEGDTSA